MKRSAAEVGRVEPADWKPVGVSQLEPSAWDALRHEGSSFVVAGPGAGKTEFLAQRAHYLFQTRACPPPHSILAISFKRDAARNLADRVRARTPDSVHRFDSLTFDAFTKGLVDRFRAALPEPWTMRGDYQVNYPRRGEITSYLDALAAKIPDWAAEIAALPRSSFVSEVVGTHQLSPGQRDPRNARELASLGWWERRYRSADPQQVDFVMLNRLAELVVRTNPAIRRALLLTYPFVFIDEFQDTTFAQYSFLHSVFGSERTVVTAVGDSKQRIMGWAGAVGDAFEQFKTDFAAARFELSWNFRSSPTMTSAHYVVAKAFDIDVSPAASRVTATIQGNPLEIWHFADTCTEARFVAEWITNDAANSGRSPDCYALLARQKTAELQPLLKRELSKCGIRLRNDDDEVGELRLQDLLADGFAMRTLDILRLAASPGGNGDAWTRVCDLITRLHVHTADDDTVPPSHRALEDFITDRRRWMLDNPPGASAIQSAVNAVVEYLGVPAIQSAFPTHRQPAYLQDTIDALTVRLQDVREGSNSWNDLCDRAEGRGAVPLMTIHKSKGLEYHTVIFLGLDDSQWWSFRQDPDEATRTFFVGLSRAEQRTIFTFCEARGGRENIRPLYDLLAEAEVVTVQA